MDKALWITSLVFLILGILLLIVGFFLDYYDQMKYPDRKYTTARVVDLLLKEAKNKDSVSSDRFPGEYRNHYFPVLEYYAEGKLYKTVFPKGAYPSPFKINQELPIVYQKRNPSVYILDTNTKRQWFPMVLKSAGAILVFLACIHFLLFAIRV